MLLWNKHSTIPTVLTDHYRFSYICQHVWPSFELVDNMMSETCSGSFLYTLTNIQLVLTITMANMLCLHLPMLHLLIIFWYIQLWNTETGTCVKTALIHLLLDKMDAVFADDIFKCIFSNENDGIPIQISLKFVPRIQIDNKQATSYYLNQWWPSLLTHICGTRGRWVHLSHLYMASLCVLSVHTRKQQQHTQSQTRTHTRTQQHPRHSLTHQINKLQHTSPDQWTNILICSLILGNTYKSVEPLIYFIVSPGIQIHEYQWVILCMI